MELISCWEVFVMKIKKSVKEAMERLHIDKLRRNQIRPINSVLSGNDTMVIAPTSYGKSLLYQIPAITNSHKLTVVIEPLLALVHDQVEKLQSLGISAVSLDSTQSKSEREQVMKLLEDGKVTLLYLAPERLETGILSQIEKHNKIGLVVVDECHCVISWGYAFREAYLEIGEWIDRLKKRPVILALSATVIPEDRSQIMELLSGEKHIIVATSALSMGVDVKDVDLVIHFNMPLSLADYYQMSGRAGREEQKARSILFYNADDYYTGMALISKIEDNSAKKRAKQRLGEMKEFCEDTEHCMVQTMLRALGNSTIGKCRYCTNCQRER